jgi:choline kinase
VLIEHAVGPPLLIVARVATFPQYHLLSYTKQNSNATNKLKPLTLPPPAVSIAEPDSISPLMCGKRKDVPPEQDGEYFNLDRTISSPQKQHRAKVGSSRRLSGRPSTEALPRVRHHERHHSGNLVFQPSSADTTTPAESGHDSIAPSTMRHGYGHKSHSHDHDGLFAQITAWIQHEKARRKKRKQRGKEKRHERDRGDEGTDETAQRRESDVSSEGSAALEKLQEILEKTMAISGQPSIKTRSISSIKKLRRQSTGFSSDTDYVDGEVVVPHADVFLDNSKTLSYTPSSADIKPMLNENDRPPLYRLYSSRDRDAWKTFKFEIVRLAHTLRLKGWRRVSMEMSSKIEVERLSGALTNAVYVVSPPKNLPPRTPGSEPLDENSAEMKQPIHRPPPPKLLLRIYGSQVDHLIDRTAELAILRRLARKHIGPRLLGTFTNGRFEEFFHAVTLTPKDLRDPEMSQQIAKRMRELHEGIELLIEERQNGPFVFKNIDKWAERCSKIVSWLDSQVVEQAKKAGEQPRYVCGTPWPQFMATIQQYRTWLTEQYGGPTEVKQALVFAHNDAQYGNILRLVPAGTSPLLLPSNAHKRLVVIDFEYANANLPALEFANHFSEWCYNYHDPDRPWHCSTRKYPTKEEQERFVRAYVMHTPHFREGSGRSEPNTPGLFGKSSVPPSPALMPTSSSVSSSLISSFMLDSRFPLSQGSSQLQGSQGQSHAQQQRAGPPTPSSSINIPKAADVSMLLSQQKAQRDFEQQEDDAREAMIANEVERLLNETRLWRLANSAQWVMWGVMQAKIPNLPAEIIAENEGKRKSIDEESCSDADDESTVLGEGEVIGNDQLRDRQLSSGTENKDQIAVEAAEKSDNDSSEEEEPEFDYLAYARDRAMFFWGDAIGLGFVGSEELPRDVADCVRVVEY